MIRRHLPSWFRLRRTSAPIIHLIAPACAVFALTACASMAAQVLTIDTSGKSNSTANGPIDRQYAQITPTKVDLPKAALDPKTRLMLIREMQSEQGFAMRPFPRGHRGLTLEANGKLVPAGEAYLNMVVSNGLSAKPGARLVITDIKVDRDKIVLDLNDGPDAKHRFLRHVQIGMGPDMGDPDVDPSIADEQGDPAGSRLTVTFRNYVPELTSHQFKELLAPLISFDVKTPIQAFTDTLPPALKKAILDHQVLVGMSTDMVLFAKGRPQTKSREMDGQMPFEEWIYGTPPEEVDFVRVNGNRVIRVEIAKDGEPLQVFTKDVVSAMLRTDGTPVLTAQSNTRVVREGDVEIDPNKQEAAPPPTLRNPGEQLPAGQNTGTMRPVQMPKPHNDDDQLGANPDEQQQTPATSQQPSQSNGQPSATPAQPANSQAAPAKGQPSPQQPSSTAGQQSAPSNTQPPPAGTQPPPAGSSQFVTASGAASPPGSGGAQSN